MTFRGFGSQQQQQRDQGLLQASQPGFTPRSPPPFRARRALPAPCHHQPFQPSALHLRSLVQPFTTASRAPLFTFPSFSCISNAINHPCHFSSDHQNVRIEDMRLNQHAKPSPNFCKDPPGPLPTPCSPKTPSS